MRTFEHGAKIEVMGAGLWCEVVVEETRVTDNE